MRRYLQPGQKGAIPIIALLAAVGILGFLLIFSIFNHRDRYFQIIFPKPSSEVEPKHTSTISTIPTSATTATTTITTLLPNNWSIPVKLGFPVNYGGSEDMPYISPDGKELYFVYNPCDYLSGDCPDSSYFPRPGVSDTRRTYNMYSTKKVDGNWLEPKYLPYPLNRPELLSQSGSLRFSSDGSTVYFMQGGLTNPPTQNIYVSQKQPNGWSEPYNISQQLLPGTSNACDEDAPTLTADGKTLYFYILGGDPGKCKAGKIYVSTRDDPSCDSCWRQAQILPAPVNSQEHGITDWHPFISPYGTTLYFSSDRLTNPYNCPGDNERRLAIFFSRKNTNDTWTQPEILNIPYPNPCDSNSYLVAAGGQTLTSDEQILYFVAARGVYGQPPSVDIYMVSRIQ